MRIVNFIRNWRILKDQVEDQQVRIKDGLVDLSYSA